MNDSQKFLGASAVVFRVLAWVSLVIQAVVGVIVLATGGEPVNLGGLDVPARAIGLLNCVAGVLYFFLFYLISHAIRVVLEIRRQVAKLSR